jgi:uncharacterized protein YacL
MALGSRCFWLVARHRRAFAQSEYLPREPVYVPWLVFAGFILAAGAIIALDIKTGRKRLDTITSVYFGLIIGLFLTFILKTAFSIALSADSPYTPWALLILGSVLCYTCISILMQTKDDFRFIIPYVEFAKEIKGLKPYLLDTSVVIDLDCRRGGDADHRQSAHHAAVRRG